MSEAVLSFSFVVPCLDAEDTLGDCIRHLRKIRWPQRAEVIVVDNGSVDHSVEIARELADKALVDDMATIAGLRNLGAKQASGDIIVFVDSDCLLHEDWLDITAGHLRDPGVVMVGAKTHILPERSTWVAKAWKVHLDRTEIDPSPTWLVTRALAVRRAAFLAIGGFDTDLETCEDVALGHALGTEGTICNDVRLAPTHLKDADSLRALFYKERWRGKDSVKTSIQELFVDERWNWKEAISLALPFYFLASFCLFAVSLLVLLIDQKTGPFIAALLLIGIPIAILAGDAVLKTRRFLWFLPLCIVYAVYIAARVSALAWKN